MKLEIDKIKVAEDYLKKIGQLPAHDRLISLKAAGEGNMNLTLRAVSEGGISLIMKQARPYVQKYPSIAAPVNRAEMESTFFRLAGAIPGVGELLPALIHFDAVNHVQIIEDLGKGNDFTDFYLLDEKPSAQVVDLLSGFLRALHEGSKGMPPIANTDMRALNHAHIFDLPFRENAVDLKGIQHGLHEMAAEIIFPDKELKGNVRKYGEIYLSAKGPSLLHGDFFPGSWLVIGSGVRIIDPEFCFSGPVEFDLGVYMAHLHFCGWKRSEIEEAMHAYGPFDITLARGFMGTEILRRIFGVAQLPLKSDIEYKRNLATDAITMIKS